MKKSIILFLVSMSLVCGCQQKAAQETDERIPVKAMRVALKEFEDTVEYVGDLKSVDEIAVFSKVTGKLFEYTVKEGDRVEKGETIALVDRDETGLKFELARVESPISGIVGKTMLDKGANVLPSATFIGGQPLAIMVNMDQMVVKFNVPEPVIPYLKTGLKAEVRVDAYPADVFGGEVSKISEVLDTETRTLPIEISVDNKDHRLKSGMFAKVKLILSKHAAAPYILKEAVIGREPDLYVFAVEDKKALLKKISSGIRQGPYLEVKEGLIEGDLVVIMGQQKLFEFAPVNVEIAEE